MGQLKHGIYNDECEDLTYEEINTLYGFGEDGELMADQLDDSEDSNSEDDEDNYEQYKSEIDMEV